MKRRSISIFLLLILMNLVDDVYAVEQVKAISDQSVSSNTIWMSEQEEIASSLEVALKQGSNFIQPEGITNICSEISFKVKCKEFSYQIDISSLVNESNNTVKLMNYDLDRIRVQIVDLKNASILTKQAYMVEPSVDHQIKIHFVNQIIEEGSTYKIIIYIPTTIGRQVIYGGKDMNSYLNKYVYSQRLGAVRTIVEACPKIDEVLDGNDQMIEQYSDRNVLKEYSISLNYMEIPKIY